MKLEPLDRFRPKPYAILYPGRRSMEVQSVDGMKVAHGKRDVEELLKSLAGCSLYVLDALDPLIHTTGALSWSLSIWKGRTTRATHRPSGSSVVSLRGTLDPSNAFDDLETVLLWLRSYGVVSGSIPSMAWSLFRASLSRSYSCGFDPEIGKAAFFGGRQEASKVGIYTDMKAIDIRAAYPAAMARPEGYALTLRSVDPSTSLDPTLSGIAEAEVYVPHDLPFAPLPIRIDKDLISFQKGSMRGFWPWCELATARRLGAEVKVLRSWGPARQADLFGPWWPLAQEGRDLGGRAGVLAKAISNSTWGQFGMAAEDRARRQYIDDDGESWVDVPIDDQELPHSWTAHVAAETTGRVRSQILEAMEVTTPAHIDTDGIIVPSSSFLPGGGGGEAGDWRVKSEMPQVDLRGPQLYRWTCPECGHAHEHWHYNASGIPRGEVAEFFDGGSKSHMIEVNYARE